MNKHNIESRVNGDEFMLRNSNAMSIRDKRKSKKHPNITWLIGYYIYKTIID
jgi:hypothetical protein